MAVDTMHERNRTIGKKIYKNNNRFYYALACYVCNE